MQTLLISSTTPLLTLQLCCKETALLFRPDVETAFSQTLSMDVESLIPSHPSTTSKSFFHELLLKNQTKPKKNALALLRVNYVTLLILSLLITIFLDLQAQLCSDGCLCHLVQTFSYPHVTQDIILGPYYSKCGLQTSSMSTT